MHAIAHTSAHETFGSSFVAKMIAQLDHHVVHQDASLCAASIGQRQYQHELCFLGQVENPKAIIRCLEPRPGSFAVSNLYLPLSQG
jgi:hypothetical protein